MLEVEAAHEPEGRHSCRPVPCRGDKNVAFPFAGAADRNTSEFASPLPTWLNPARMSFELLKKDSESRARLGRLTTPRGEC